MYRISTPGVFFLLSLINFVPTLTDAELEEYWATAVASNIAVKRIKLRDNKTENRVHN